MVDRLLWLPSVSIPSPRGVCVYVCVSPGRAVRENRRRVSERSWAGLARGDRKGSGPDAGWDRLHLLHSLSPRCCPSLIPPPARARGSAVKLARADQRASGIELSKIKARWRASHGRQKKTMWTGTRVGSTCHVCTNSL